MQPTMLNKKEHYNNRMALKVFTYACLEWMSDHNNFDYDVEMTSCYFDFGQDWKWTTIVVTNEETGSHWQALSPRDWELIVTCDSIDKLVKMAYSFMDTIAEDGDVRLWKTFEG